MKQYWPCAKVLKKDYISGDYVEGKQFTYDSCLSLKDAIRVIRVWQTDMLIKEAWVDVVYYSNEDKVSEKIILNWDIKSTNTNDTDINVSINDNQLIIDTDKDIDISKIDTVILNKTLDRLVVKRVFSV